MPQYLNRGMRTTRILLLARIPLLGDRHVHIDRRTLACRGFDTDPRIHGTGPSPHIAQSVTVLDLSFVKPDAIISYFQTQPTLFLL